MDTFTEKFSHNRSAQEMIQANSAADAAKMELLQNRVNEYEVLLQDMRRVNLKAAENMEQMQKLLEEAYKKIAEIKEDKSASQEKGEALIEEMRTQIDEIAGQMQKQMKEAFENSDEFLHKENVKVYRNVQAAMTEEFGRQTETLTKEQQESAKKQKMLLPISVVIMLMLIVDIVINLFNIVVKL